jgi:hypothetical protein
MTKKRGDPKLAKEKAAFASFPIVENADPVVHLPADVKASIARAEAAVASNRTVSTNTTHAQSSDFRTAVIDQKVQEELDDHLKKVELDSKGKRQQPPMTNRLRAISIFVAREMADGTPFAAGPNSTMNRKVRAWLNSLVATTSDERKSRKKPITAGAVRAVLRQVKSLLHPSD